MTDEQTVEQEDDYGADIAKAIDEVSTEPVEQTEAVDIPDGRDEKGRFAKTEKAPEIVTPTIVKDPPSSWTPHKDKFATLPPDIQELIRQREDEVHKGFTKLDEERNFGKQIKEVITPYMPQIVAEGGDPAKAVQSLLNTAYQLRMADPQTKAQLVGQIIQQYGVDMRYLQPGQQQAPVDPRLNSMMQEMQTLKQTLSQQQSLQQQSETAKIQQEYQAFAAKPENAHANHPEVKAAMASLLEGGRAQGYQDAYDTAVYMVPEVRSTILSTQSAQTDAKRKEDLASKKNAGSSVTGSPGLSVANTGPAVNPNSTYEEDIAEAMKQLGVK